MKKKKITALIPCYNEGDGIANVINAFPLETIRKQGFELEIVVIDNASTDNTAEVARSLGVKVLSEHRKGKGYAIRTGFNSITSETDYVVMLDGDATYRPEEMLRLIELLDSGFCNVAIGSRLGGRITEGSMSLFNRAGNWIFSHLVRYFYRVSVTDVLTGYFAWKRESLERLRPHLISKGFAIEMEMITKMARLGEDIYSVPITYVHRAGESNLNPVKDGVRILKMFMQNLVWKPLIITPRRIAFVSDSIMPYFRGGKEKRLHEISKRLVQQGSEVHIYTMQWWEGEKTMRTKDGVYLHAITRLYPMYTDDRRSIREALFFGLGTLKLLFERFDVLDVDQMPFFPLISARIVTWLRFKKLHATWHEVWGWEYWKEYLEGTASIFGYAVEWISMCLPDVIISNSYHTTARLHALNTTKKIVTIPLGVDLQEIYLAKIASETSDVIFVGRLLKHKNTELLIHALALVKETNPKITCNIIGRGPEKKHIVSLINQLGLQNNVRILENVASSKSIYGLMKASSMLVLPSIREGFGLVVVEALASGIPVITVSHEQNAAKDLVQDGINGYIVEATAEDIAEKIKMILKNRHALKPSEGITEYDWEVVTRNISNAMA